MPDVVAGRYDLAAALARVADGTAWRAEDPRRKASRVRRLCGPGHEHGGEVHLDEVLQRTIAQPDLRPVHWLATGLRVAQAVALVEGHGFSATGFLVAPWLLMTNAHVLPDPDTASAVRARFAFQEEPSGSVPATPRLVLDPDRFFVTSPVAELDCTVVAVGAVPGSDDPPGAVFGTIPLFGATGKILEGEPVNIVQHPGGRPKEIAFRDNRLLALVDDDVMTYSTDTDVGSSGSPVLNDQWELVGLHRSSVEATDGQGRPLDRHGRPIDGTTPEALRRWTANKGSRVSALVRELGARRYAGGRAALARSLLGEGT
jgi:endonuclease G